MIDIEDALITLDYSANGQPMRYDVRLVYTVPRFGGRRWWFMCPLQPRNGGHAACREAPPSSWRAILCQPCALWPDVPVKPGERGAPRAVQAPGAGYGNRRGSGAPRLAGVLRRLAEPVARQGRTAKRYRASSRVMIPSRVVERQK